MSWTDQRFASHMDSPLIQNPAQKAVAVNFDSLADTASAKLGMAYLYRTVNKGASHIDNTGMAKLLGCVGVEFNSYGVGGSAGVETFTVDPTDTQWGKAGRTLRLGRPRGNWEKHLADDPRPVYLLPAVDLTKTSP